MPRRVIFEPEARREFEAAVAWYNKQKPSLGAKFEAEVSAIFDRIEDHPGRFRLVGKSVRVARLRVFEKHSVYFFLEPDFIGVVAVFHSSRDPGTLKPRLK